MKRNRALIILLVVAIIAMIALLAIVVSRVSQTPQVVYVTPQPTTETTPQVIYVTPEPTEAPPEATPQVIYVTPEPTEEATQVVQVIYITPEPTTEPTPVIQVVYITPEPTEEPKITPEVVYVPVYQTEAPTEEPTAEPVITPAPTSGGPIVIYYYTAPPVSGSYPTPTFVPTLAPTQYITSAPTPELTAAPTFVPTPAPTEAPTQQPTPEPTQAPTQKPTDAPTAEPTESPEEISNKKIKRILGEVNKAQAAGEVIPTRDMSRNYDFNGYTDISNVNQQKLFTELKSFFIKVVAHSFEFDFQTGSTPEKNLEASLKSGRGSDGKLILGYDDSGESAAIMEEILCGITDYEKANSIMLSFINENTTSNPSNSNERLFIVSSN